MSTKAKIGFDIPMETIVELKQWGWRNHIKPEETEKLLDILKKFVAVARGNEG